MLEQFTIETFAPLQGEQFQLTVPAAPSLSLLLAEVTPLGATNVPVGAQRAPFSLLFLGPTTPLLSQQIYPLSHPDLGRFALFLVPIDSTQEGIRYQAIFT